MGFVSAWVLSNRWGQVINRCPLSSLMESWPNPPIVLPAEMTGAASLVVQVEGTVASSTGNAADEHRAATAIAEIQHTAV